jgi:hypothetical protein
MSLLQRTLSKMKNSGSGPKKAVSPMPDGLQVGLGALGHRARVAVVGLPVAGLEDVAGQDQRRVFAVNGSMLAVDGPASAPCRRR